MHILRPQDHLRIPDIFSFPIKNVNCALNITWDCGDCRAALVFLDDVKKQASMPHFCLSATGRLLLIQTSQYPKLAVKREWRSLA